MPTALMSTDLPLANKRTGKVRDLYDLTLSNGDAGLLIIATDRVSAFDVVLANGLPNKGVMLTRIARFWFDYFKDRIPNHLVSTDAAEIPGLSAEQRAPLEGRIMICRKADVVPVECIVRGYLTGSGWKDYQKSGAVCGIKLPSGMQNSSMIDEPIFTPSTKADEGHDENISFDRAAEVAGAALMEDIRDRSLAIYAEAREYARIRGIIIADTKFEFGMEPGADQPTLIDEVLTPDSSRFWPADDWAAGREQDSFDKQVIRNYLQGRVDAGEWDKQYPGPTLPDEVIARASERYEEAVNRLTA
jgi:phosphoribosylaminoimidazole-succinocarboxamide synthase